MRAKSEKIAENCTFSFEHAIFCNIDFANEVNSFSFTPHTHIKLVEELMLAQTSSYTNAHPPRARAHTYTQDFYFLLSQLSHLSQKQLI